MLSIVVSLPDCINNTVEPDIAKQIANLIVSSIFLTNSILSLLDINSFAAAPIVQIKNIYCNARFYMYTRLFNPSII